MAEVTKSDIEQIKKDLGNMANLGEKSDMLDSILYLLATPEEEFTILAPGILEAFKRSVNNPNDKLALVQATNAAGLTSDDLTGSFLQLVEEIEKTNLSIQKKDFLKEMLGQITTAVNETEGIAKRIIKIPIEFCHEDAKMPAYAHESDSGMDLYALEDITIKPGETVLVPTGLKVALPPGYELQVRPKSGRALKTKLRVANTPGTIDAGYRDEIKVIIENVDPPIRSINIQNWSLDEDDPAIHFSDIEFGQSYTIGKGEKFAQLVLAEVPKASFFRIENVKEIGEDRLGGFGSSGLV